MREGELAIQSSLLLWLHPEPRCSGEHSPLLTQRVAIDVRPLGCCYGCTRSRVEAVSTRPCLRSGLRLKTGCGLAAMVARGATL